MEKITYVRITTMEDIMADSSKIERDELLTYWCFKHRNNPSAAEQEGFSKDEITQRIEEMQIPDDPENPAQWHGMVKAMDVKVRIGVGAQVQGESITNLSGLKVTDKGRQWAEKMEERLRSDGMIE